MVPRGSKGTAKPSGVRRALSGDPDAKPKNRAFGEREEIGHFAKVSFVDEIGPGATIRKGQKP